MLFRSNPFDSLMAMVYIMQERSALAYNLDNCDCLIRPEISQYSSWGFGDCEKMLAEGRKAAEDALPQLSQFSKK